MLPMGDVEIAVLLAGLVFVGAGGAQQPRAVQLDPREGLRHGQVRAEYPVAADRRAEPQPSTGTMMKQDEENLKCFRGWWKVANKEQLVSFWAICLASIITFSVLAYSTVGVGANLSDEPGLRLHQGRGRGPQGRRRGRGSARSSGSSTQCQLMLVALGVVDYVARLVADALKTLHLRDNTKGRASRRSTPPSCG